jgi:phosphoribosylcarboxyaminoimidazole (NCAIR) mutase
LAIEILGIENASLIAKLVEFRQSQHDAALESGEKLD